MTAAGPYTEANNLSYAPLEDLLSKVLTNKPDLLVLMGPFVDTSQEVLASGDMVRIMLYYCSSSFLVCV
jgi:DNA polymerase alpha subunit B